MDSKIFLIKRQKIPGNNINIKGFVTFKYYFIIATVNSIGVYNKDLDKIIYEMNINSINDITLKNKILIVSSSKNKISYYKIMKDFNLKKSINLGYNSQIYKIAYYKKMINYMYPRRNIIL